MFQFRFVFLLPILLLLSGTGSKVLALNCSEKTVRAAVEAGWEPSMIASICPKYKAILEAIEAKAKLADQPPAPSRSELEEPLRLEPEISQPASSAAQALSSASALPRSVQGCTDYDRAEMVLVGVKREVILEMCGDPRPLRRRKFGVPVPQTLPAPQALPLEPEPEPAPEPQPLESAPEPKRKTEPQPEPEPAPEQEPELSETEPASVLPAVTHRIGLGFGLHTGTHSYQGISTSLSGSQLFLPYYFYHLDEQLLLGAQLRRLQIEGSGSGRYAYYELLAHTASAGYLWRWNDFQIGGQGFFGLGTVKFRYNENNTDWPSLDGNGWLYGIEAVGLYDLWDSLHVGATFDLAFGGTEIRYSNGTTALISPGFGYAVLVGYGF